MALSHPVWAKKKIQQLAARALGYRAYFFSEAAHGHQEVMDLKRRRVPVNVIFDVGANCGQSALKFLAAFPEAKIFSFEPVAGTFLQMQKKLRNTGVHCHKLALSSKPGMAAMSVGENSLVSTLGARPDAVSSETVEVTTVDKFATEQGIHRIDLLKVDAEGFDLEVLKGAEKMLTNGGVGAVIAEVGFHPCDKRFVLFDEVRDLLIAKGFSLFGIYDQQPEWSGEKRLGYANVLFLNVPAFVSNGTPECV